MTAVGYICIAVAAVWFLYKLRLSYNSVGGTVIETVYDAAVYPPILTTFGLYWVLRSFDVQWAIWAYLVIWLLLTPLAAGAIRLAEDLGDRPLR